MKKLCKRCCKKQPRHRDKLTAHRVSSQPQALEGIGTQERLCSCLAEDHKGKLRTAIHPNPGASDVPLL